MDELHRIAASIRWKLLQRNQSKEQQQQPIKTESTTTISSSPEIDIEKRSLREKELQIKVSNLLVSQERVSAENKELTRRLDQRSQQLLARNNELTAAKEEVKALKTERNKLKEDLDRRSNEAKGHDYFLGTMKNEMAMVRRTMEGIETDFRLLQQENHGLAETHEHTVNALAAVQKDRDAAHKNAAEIKKELQLMEERMIAEERDKLALSASEMILTSRNQDLESVVARANKAVEIMEEQVASLNRQCQHLQGIAAGHEDQFKESNQIITKLQRAYDATVAQQNVLITEKDAEIAEVTEQLYKLSRERPSQSAVTKNHSYTIMEPVIIETPPVEPITRPATPHYDPGVVEPIASTEHREVHVEPLPTDYNGNDCGICNEAPFGLMVICAGCQLEFHSACTKTQGRCGEILV